MKKVPKFSCSAARGCAEGGSGVCSDFVGPACKAGGLALCWGVLGVAEFRTATCLVDH